MRWTGSRACLNNPAVCARVRRASLPKPLAHAAGLAALVATLWGCAPTLDWREVRPTGSRAQLLMPCKPTSQERRVPLAGERNLLTMYACTAGDQTWSLAFADVGDPARMGSVLQALVKAAGNNVSAGQALESALLVPGATPHVASRMAVFQGQMPGGKAVAMQVAVFAHGTQAFQASVIGSELPAEAVQTFMGSIRFAN